VFFALIRFEINSDNLCDEIKNLITPEMLPALFKLSKRHDLAHLFGDALDKNGLLPDGTEAKKRFSQERNMAIYRYEQMQYEFEQICMTLENAKIEFIPLKGAVIRQYFPAPWMRTSCDIDILVKEENLLTAIDTLTQVLNYHHDSTGNHDAHLFAESGVHLELHYKLNPNDEQWNTVLTNIWEYLQDIEAYHCSLADEMFYFYHIAHMAGHFKIGGCGIRPFLDLYLLRKYVNYKQEQLIRLLEEGGLLAFNQGVCALSDYWFAGTASSQLAIDIQDFIFNAGMYGGTENRVSIDKVKKGNKLGVLFSRIFLPYDRLKFQYPILQKHKILVPFYQVKRWFNLLNKGKRKQAVQELQSTVHQDEAKSARIERLLNDLGL
jgi:hypothetical protein